MQHPHIVHPDAHVQNLSKSDSEETIQLRLKNSIKELEYEKEYEVTIINKTVEESCAALRKIIEDKYN